MKLLGLAALGGFLIMCVTIGARLLLLSRRTRGAPEFCAGAGLLCLGVVGHPFSVLGRLPALVNTLPGNVLFGIGMATTAAGVALMYEFTRRTFRPGDAWALGLVIVAALASSIEAAGLMTATAGAARVDDILPRARPWTIAICLTLAGSFAWTTVEGTLCYRRLKKRTALGLADPVVTNRVWLWAASGVAVTIPLVEIALLASRGRMVLLDPVALFATALSGVAASSFWYLAFLPPQAYTRWIQQRAAARGA